MASDNARLIAAYVAHEIADKGHYQGTKGKPGKVCLLANSSARAFVEEAGEDGRLAWQEAWPEFREALWDAFGVAKKDRQNIGLDDVNDALTTDEVLDALWAVALG